MKLPVIQGLIDRRILVNYRVDPAALRRVVPEPFQIKEVNGSGVAGVCLIRLAQIRPRFIPPFLGISSENAAHRIAVEWDSGGERREGVFIPRRDTSSRLNVLVGGRVFPGEHHPARFEVREAGDRFTVDLRSADGQTRVHVEARLAADLPKGSVFDSLESASQFFEAGSVGYSACAAPGRYDGLELRSFAWKIEPLQVERIESSFFEDGAVFPPGAAKFDSAFLMRGIRHEWHALPTFQNDHAVVG